MGRGLARIWRIVTDEMQGRYMNDLRLLPAATDCCRFLAPRIPLRLCAFA
ncbi:hypothetical protein PLANPX_5840 [Lacipirellula parvula]|uniref:Uncharacterized protein n=1 Tax=Lacipirellula parvula TaxID=2650471 RepID=A0A5K7XIF1_9BACT|nr:hypothetical protein PLANPX_5840 [Lacipirellula parvula]